MEFRHALIRTYNDMENLFFFFFQAEDGIRDLTVTGVQTCALPIYWLTQHFGWPGALRTLGILLVLIALPMAFFIKESPGTEAAHLSTATPVSIGRVLKSWHFYLLAIGSMCSIGAVGGTFQNLKLFMT